ASQEYAHALHHGRCGRWRKIEPALDAVQRAPARARPRTPTEQRPRTPAPGPGPRRNGGLPNRVQLTIPQHLTGLFMGRPIDLGRYGTVDQRIRAFYQRFPDGAIQTDLVRLEPDFVLFRARVFRDRIDPAPTTGWAYDRPPADDGAAARRVLASCEAAAVGRALANLGLAGPLRPSREEMEKVVRLRTAREGHARSAPPADPAAGAAQPGQRIRELLAELRLPAE